MHYNVQISTEQLMKMDYVSEMNAGRPSKHTKRGCGSFYVRDLRLSHGARSGITDNRWLINARALYDVPIRTTNGAITLG